MPEKRRTKGEKGKLKRESYWAKSTPIGFEIAMNKEISGTWWFSERTNIKFGAYSRLGMFRIVRALMLVI
jgi:hypothetical protein